ncbi:transglutaminase-like domain-containing protein [bacterium]|nr:transglutaminase-like domain-containing protein [bacterium]
MKNKKLFPALISLIICLFLIATISTGCLYGLGKNIGEQLESEITTTSSLISDDVAATQETIETTGSISQADNSITENNSTTEDTSTTKLPSATFNTDDNNSQDNNNLKNEIQISFDMDYIFNVSGEVSGISFIVIIPKEYKDRQRIINTQYSIEPKRIFDDGPNTYAEFEISNPASNFEINVIDEIVLNQYDLNTAFNSGNKDFDIENLVSYKNAEKYIESDDEDIKKIARTFEGEDIYSLVQVIYNYVMDNMEWVGYVPEDVGAKAALIEKQGDCTSYSDLFIALLRAYGIPARIVEGYVINATDLSIGHNWVEVYFNDIGWVPFDPTFDDNNGSTSLFNNLNNIYVYFSSKRNDSALNGFHYFVYNWYGTGKVEVLKNISVN